MIQKDLIVQNKLGLHARAAGKLSHTAHQYMCTICAHKNGTIYDVKRVLAVMMMGCSYGETMHMEFSGSDETEAAGAMQALFEAHFGEPD